MKIKKDKKLNFIVFNPDELRAESLGCYGHPFVKTPNFDTLAQEGIRFNQCHVQNSVCSPSRIAFMTGLYVHNSGHRSLWNLLKKEEPNLLKSLKMNGYDVAWYGKNDLLAEDSFADSVTYSEHIPGKRKKHIRSPNESIEKFYSFLDEPVGIKEEDQDYLTIQKGCEFLKTQHNNPFFLFLTTGRPHPPYTAPDEFYSLYSKAQIDYLRPAGKNKPPFHKYMKDYRHLDKLDIDILKKIQAVYLGSISYVDYLLGELIKSVQLAGLEDETVIITFSDHGDYAGDYGMVEKWPNGMEDVLTRVPLIVRAPGYKQGLVIEDPVELFDFMPTVLELADVKPSHHYFAHSLVPYLKGKKIESNKWIFAEGGYNPIQDDECFEGNPHFGGNLLNLDNIYYPKAKIQQDHPESVCRTVMMRNKEIKYIKRTSGENELYFLTEDPLELDNQFYEKTNKNLIQKLETELLDWYLRTSDLSPLERDVRNKPENFVKKFV